MRPLRRNPDGTGLSRRSALSLGSPIAPAIGIALLRASHPGKPPSRPRGAYSEVPQLLTFRGGTRKDSGHAFRIDVERQECQRHVAWVSPLMHKTERFVDQRTRRPGLQLTFHGICARSRDDVIERRA